MNCRACFARLEYHDNYCRKCGAAVEVVEVEVLRSSQARQISAVSTVRQVALPVVAQSVTMLLAGTLVKFALRQLLSRRNLSPRSIFPLDRRDARDGVVEELLYYRRSRAR